MKKFLAILMALRPPDACTPAGPTKVNWADLEGTVAASGIEGELYPVSDIGV